MNIIFFETTTSEEQFFKNLFPGHQISFYKEPLSQTSIKNAQSADIISVFIMSRATQGILQQLPNLKLLSTRSTGTDHIDVEYCKEKNISIANVPDYGATTVAEHTFALILGLSRKIVQSMEQSKRGVFTNEALTGFDLYGKTLGIIGLGKIGQKVAKIAQGFDMKILAFTRTPKEINGIQIVSLEELLSKSDIITIHTPLTPQTLHLLNTQNLSKIKPGALLINTARGPIIQTEALVKGLESGLLSGAGLDVLEEEQTVKNEQRILTHEYIDLTTVKTLLLDHILRDLPNVIMTPHNAFNSTEALEEINTKTLAGIQNFIES